MDYSLIEFTPRKICGIRQALRDELPKHIALYKSILLNKQAVIALLNQTET